MKTRILLIVFGVYVLTACISPAAQSSPVPTLSESSQPTVAISPPTELPRKTDQAPTNEATVLFSTPTAQVDLTPTTINTAIPSTETALPQPTGTTPTITAVIPDTSETNYRVVNHTSIALFEKIPDAYLNAARALNMVYVDASVGQNINEGLNCLTAPAWGQSPASCRRDYVAQVGGEWKTFNANDIQSGSVPERIQFLPDSNRYSRSNWEFVAKPASWEVLLQGFLQDIVPVYVDQKDVLSYQFNYLHVTPDSPIADPVEGFFVDQPRQGFYSNRERWDISDLEALEAQYPDKVFMYWTTSLSRSIGSEVSTQFNDQMRAYATDNDKFLFDVADILSHDGQDQPCYDNRDGVEYCGPNGCENFPDDGQNNPAICQDYTTETEGGHLGSVSAGKIRLAKGFWVLMAMIAGWQP